MSHRPARKQNQGPLGAATVSFILLLTFLWVFLGTIDGPAVNLGIQAGSVVYKKAKAPEPQAGVQPAMVGIELPSREPPSVHASFLLFDFKQNLRRWPNVAGDISRSPPFFLA